MLARPISNRKKPARIDSWLRLLPARFWSNISLTKRARLDKRVGPHPRGAHPALGGTRKLSVPGRVHSVAESFGFRKAAALPCQSNPFLTRGTVESPAKFPERALY
jgi:hypothetical protein